MRILLCLLLFSLSVFAQESPARDGRANRDPGANASQMQNYKGCVIRSSGEIVLADAGGKEYKLLSRRGLALASYVGQEVQLSAADVNPGDQSSDERSMNSGESRNNIRALDVEQISKVSENCQSPK
jgi:hypothetical protein